MEKNPKNLKISGKPKVIIVHELTCNKDIHEIITDKTEICPWCDERIISNEDVGIELCCGIPEIINNNGKIVC